MGINTVAVLFNDTAYQLPDRMKEAVVQFRYGDDYHYRFERNFGTGQVITAAHADTYQLVVVHGNTGWTLDKAPELPYYAQDQLADCLRKHGWRVLKNARKASKRVSDL